jgi:replicative DNA helicase
LQIVREDIEKAVIGILINDKNVFDDATMLGVTADCFVGENSRAVFSYMAKARNKKQAYDLSTACIEVPSATQYLVDASTNAPLAQNETFYFRKLVDNHLNSVLIGETQAIIHRAAKGQELQKTLLEISNAAAKVIEAKKNNNETSTIKELLPWWIEELEQRFADRNSGKEIGISTGFKDLDDAITKLRNGKFYIIAARPAVGKTTLMINMAVSVARQKKYALVFEREMDGMEIITKIKSNTAQVNSKRISEGNMGEAEFSRISRATNEEYNNYLLANFKARTVEDITRVATSAKRQGKLDAIFIDYLQIFDCEDIRDKSMKTPIVERISQKLVDLSKDLGVPIVSLAQINREGDNDQIPKVSNLKGSGQIEQDADVILIMHPVPNEEGRVYVDIPKNRYGKRGTLVMETDFGMNTLREKGFK